MTKLINQIDSTPRVSFAKCVVKSICSFETCSKAFGRLKSYFTSCTGGKRLHEYCGDLLCLNLKKSVKQLYHLCDTGISTKFFIKSVPVSPSPYSTHRM